MSNDASKKYADIIDLPHHNPKTKPRMSIYDRAAQFSPFAALTGHDEVIDETKPYEIFDPNYTWKRKTVENFYAKPLQVPVFIGGELVYDSPSLQDIRAYSAVEIGKLWEEVKRFDNPHTYYVDLSQSLWDIKHEMLRKGRKGK